MNKVIKLGVGVLAGATVTNLAGLVLAGRRVGWGPFAGLYDWDKEVRAITDRYPAENHQNGIVFYGASNFRLWREMERNLEGYPVQNHGFGGSTDALLVKYADRLLYPYAPRIVFFQTGSNDYVTLSGTDEEKVQMCIAAKREMFGTFHDHLPDARFVVMSGLLLPGRSQYTSLTQKINRELKDLCDELDYMTFVDASDMTYDGASYREELFIKDGIHLNHEGQLLWRDGYILPALEQLWDSREKESTEDGRESA